METNHVTNPLKAVLELHNFLTQHDIAYVLIGGLAVQYWGEPRFTQDVDLTVLVPINETTKFVHLVTRQFKSRIPDPLDFAKRNRMVIIQTSDGTDVDISLGIPGYEEEVIRRAVDYEIEHSKKIKLCSAEDIIIHKAVAGRPIDWQDIEGIIYKQEKKLDKEYIMHWLEQFAQALEKPIDKEFKELWERSQI